MLLIPLLVVKGNPVHSHDGGSGGQMESKHVIICEHYISSISYHFYLQCISISITECDERCYHHGICQQGVCSCLPGWNGKYCSLPGCPHNCLNRGQCKQIQGLWKCICDTEYTGEDCSKAKEQECGDGVDNDLGLSVRYYITYSI